jgi:hypothetical protein
MTRASTIRAGLQTAIAAALPDTRAHVEDRFRFLDAGAVEFEQMPDRTFVLQLASQPERTNVNVCDTWRCEFRLIFFYAASQAGVEDRIAADAERIFGPCERLHETVTGVMRCDISPAGLVPAGENCIMSAWSVIVQYQLDSAVVLA